MNEIMSDPVILPTSGKVMERAVVMRHLLRYRTFSRKLMHVMSLSSLHTQL